MLSIGCGYERKGTKKSEGYQTLRKKNSRKEAGWTLDSDRPFAPTIGYWGNFVAYGDLLNPWHRRNLDWNLRSAHFSKADELPLLLTGE